MSKHEEIWTQGTQLYALGEDSEGQKIVFKVDGVHGLTPGEATKNEIPITTLEDKAKRSMNGLLDPGTASFSIYLRKGNKGHRNLEHFYKTDQKVKFAIGLDDGFGQDAMLEGDDFDLPKGRTWFVFDGSVKSFPPVINDDSAVAVNINIQVSGEGGFVWPEDGVETTSFPSYED